MRRLPWAKLVPIFTMGLSCVDAPLGPGNQPPVQMHVTVTLPPATPSIWYPRGDTLRVSVRRAGRTDPIVDSAVVIGDSLATVLLVPLSQQIDRFVATAEVHIAGQVLFLAFDAIQLTAGHDTAIALAAAYVGPGAAARSYELRLRDSTLLRGDTASVLPLVKDSLGQVLNNVPARYVSLRPTVVSVSAAGLVTALPGPLDTGRVQGFLPIGLSSTAFVRVVAKSGFLDKVSGDGQTGPLLVPLPSPIVVRVRDDAGQPLGGATVNFTADSGNGSFLPATVVSDSSGKASATWTLGGATGVQGASVSVAGVAAVRITATATGTGTADTTPIVFVSTRAGHRAVYVMNGDGSGARRVTQSPDDEYFPSWAPNRNQIAFERFVPGVGLREIFVINRDGTGERQLTFIGDNKRPRFSPVGSKIAFNSNRQEADEVWVMDADGGAQRRLMDPLGGHDVFGDWSPDGAQIVFMRQGTGSSSFRLYMADSAGADTVENDQLADFCDCSYSVVAARWSPLGGQVTATAVYTKTALATMVLARGFPRPRQPPSPSAFDGNFAYAGGEARFVLEDDGAGPHQIYAGDTTGTLTLLSPAGVAEYEPDYEPAALPFYVARVVITPHTATMISDGPSRSFTVQAFDAQNRPAAVPITWRNLSDVVVTRPDTPAVAYGIAVGTGNVSASFNGWRADTVFIPVSSGLGPDPQRFVMALGCGPLVSRRGDGTAVDTILLPTDMCARYPAYSPDGSVIAFSGAFSGNYDADIYVINANGTGLRKVTTSSSDHIELSWSPDGRQIVFAGNTAHGFGGRYHLWLVNADGTGEHQFTFGFEEADPAWSPDGSLIIYAQFFSTGFEVINGIRTADQSQITLGSSGRFPAWAPDASSFVFTQSTGGPVANGLARMALPSGLVTPLAGTPPSPPGTTLDYDFYPAVASDGRVVFQQSREIPFYGGVSQYCVVLADGSAQACITGDNSQGVSWLPAAPPNYVAHLLIAGDLATPLPSGSTRRLSASATNQHGGAIIPVGGYRWYPLDPTLATVDSTGLVTGVAPGTARILVETGIAVPDTAIITISAPVSGATRTWLGGAAAGPSDWFVAANWSPAGVPATIDSVVIPNAADAPVLTSSTIIAQLLINDGDLTLNGQTVRVTGDFQTAGSGNGAVGTGGRLTMQNPADTLVVQGNATFAGGVTSGLLTAGVLEVRGNFTQVYVGSDWNDFAASGSHRTRLTGSGAQTVYFDVPGASGQSSYFQDLEVANSGGGVTFTTNAVANGALRVTAPTALTGPGTLTVGDSLVTVAGSAVTPAGLRLGGGMAVAGSLAPATLEFFGTGQFMQPGLTYQSGVVTGTVSAAGPTVFSGSLTINNGDLTLNGQTVRVTGDFQTAGSGNGAVGTGGRLTMQNPADTLVVQGNATFAGGVTTGLLTAGVLEVRGNFTQVYVGSDWNDFAASGSHRTRLTGSGAQTVHFDVPGASGQSSYFQDLEVANSGGGVTFTTNAVANGALRVRTGVSQSLVGGGHALTVGGLDVDSLTLDNVAFTWNGTAFTKFDDVTFANYATTATQFTVTQPGAAAGFTCNRLVFLVTPTTGFYVSATDSAPVDGNVLTLILAGSQPLDGSAYTATSGGAAVSWTP